MSSINEAMMLVTSWPPPANQLNNKYFVNQVQSNLSSSNEAASDSVVSTTNGTVVETSTVATSRTVIETNKYFVSNVSLLSLENEAHSNASTISPTISSKSRLKSTSNQSSMAMNRTKTVAHHHHHHGKTNGSTAANRTHFQIAQKQLTLSKNIRTEPPPMLPNHILDSLSVSNSKHLHHDHRFVSSIILQFWKTLYID